ncbi:MAG: bactofilin family protein [Treponema sp.]
MKNNDKVKNLTVLGKETSFDGVLKFSDDLHIEGKFNGAIDAKGVLYIAKGAVCKVQYIKAISIVVEGTVEGPIAAVGDVELKPNAVVIGDISANRLKIADNVSFDGAIHMASNAQAISEDVFTLDVSQFRQELVKE